MTKRSRRDRCHLIGKRAAKLTADQASKAWATFAAKIEAMGSVEATALPKFEMLLSAAREATIEAKKP